jgi:hypothetical protein
MKQIDDTIITRVEIIDEEWRKYVWTDKKIEISIQDDWKTMKVFIYNN